MLLKLNLQFFGEEETIESDGWDDIVDSHSDDEQPTEDSEDTHEEDEDIAEDEVEPDSDDEDIEDETEETDEDNEDEAEESDEDDEQEDDEESEDDETEESEIELADDTEIELGDETVTFKELKDGYLRQSDYTKKTQELAEQRKDVEQLEEWMTYWSDRPFLQEQIMNALQEWENTGVVPINQVLDGSKYGKYIDQLMKDKVKLQQENDELKGKYETTEFESQFKDLTNDLKQEYGNLVTDDYLQSLRSDNEGLSIDILRRVADGELAKKQLEQEKKQSKKAVAKSKQRQKSKRLPPQPKPKGQTPRTKSTADGWGELLGVDD